MKVGPIALKLRAASTRFGNLIAGAAEFGYAWGKSLKSQMAFVVPLLESASANTLDNGISQLITERFAVVVVINNDTTDKDKTGLIAYDSIHDIRTEILSAILGWTIPGSDDPVSYGGGKILNINAANLWYQFEFITSIRITDDDGIDVGADSLDDFNTIYAQWELSPSENLPVGGVPITTFTPDMTTIIDLTDDPRYGAFSRGFLPGFDIYDKDRRS